VENKNQTVYLILAEKAKKINPLYCLLVVVVLINLYYNLNYITKPILEWYSFRQTQTALTAQYIAIDGFKLAYETPVVGMPWSIPFEFPIYQLIVALLYKVTGGSLTDFTVLGRSVSLIFFVLCSLAINKIMFLLKSKTEDKIILQAMYWASPVYLFWAGSFMIETAALFFILMFIVYSMKLIMGQITYANILLLAGFLTLAMLQKITTALPVLIIFFAITVLSIRIDSLYEEKYKYILYVFLVFGSCLIAYSWIAFTDSVKGGNLIGVHLTSKNLQNWNYGSFNQRFDSKLWYDVVFLRLMTPLFGLLSLIVLIAGFFVANVKSRIIIVTSLTLFITPFLIFSNLHIQHDYYQVANYVFYMIAIGYSLSSVKNIIYQSSIKYGNFINISMPIIFCATLLYGFSGSILYKQKIIEIDPKTEKNLMIANFVKSHTSEDDIVVWYGMDWNSMGAFYSGRRSLTVPDYGNIQLDAIKNTDKYINKSPGAITICPFNQREIVEAIVMDKYPSAKVEKIIDCNIYIL
jgi:hypothetical protein